MKAGFGKVDITPEIGCNLNGYYDPRYSKSIITPLYASCAAFSDGETTVLAISIDILEILMVDTDDIRARVSARTGIPVEAIFVHATHTHTGPVVSEIRGFFKRDAAYYEYFCKKVGDSALIAISDMADAEAFIARSKAEKTAFIRRFRMKDGTVKTNPRWAELSNIEAPMSEADDSVQLVKITREGKADIAIVNYANHPDNVGEHVICADYPEYIRTTIEAALADEADGKGVLAIYFNGPQGDVNSCNRMDRIDRPASIKLAKHLGRAVAGAVLSVYTYAEPIDSEKVFFAEKMAPISFDKGTDEQVAWAKEYDAKYLEMRDTNTLPKDFTIIDLVLARKFLRTERLSKDADMNISCFGFGDVAFVGFPGEPFTKIGTDVKADSPFKMTLTCCNTNGSEGYFATDDALLQGGYESTSCLFSPGVAPSVTKTAIDVLKTAFNKKA